MCYKISLPRLRFILSLMLRTIIKKRFHVSAVCGGNLIAGSQPQTFSTPFYPRLYSNGISCEWNISASATGEFIILVFLFGRTEDCCDHVEVSAAYRFLLCLKLASTKSLQAHPELFHSITCSCGVVTPKNRIFYL